MKYNPYSVSKIGTFDSCQKKFQYQYILKPKIEKEPQLALLRGSFAHEILENMEEIIVNSLDELPKDFQILSID